MQTQKIGSSALPRLKSFLHVSLEAVLITFFFFFTLSQACLDQHEDLRYEILTRLITLCHILICWQVVQHCDNVLQNTLPCRKRTLARTICTEKASKKRFFSQKPRTWTESYSYSVLTMHAFFLLFLFCNLLKIAHNYKTEIMNKKDTRNMQVTSFTKKFQQFQKIVWSCNADKDFKKLSR